MSSDSKETRLFVYGTLMSDGVVNSVAGEGNWKCIDEHAILYDYEKRGLNIAYNSGKEVHGRILEVNDHALRAIDNYESLGHVYQYVKVTPEGYKEPMFAYQIIGTDQ